MDVTQIRIESAGPEWASYRLEAKEGEALVLAETVTISLTGPAPLDSLNAAVEAFTTRASQVAANMAIMP